MSAPEYVTDEAELLDSIDKRLQRIERFLDKLEALEPKLHAFLEAVRGSKLARIFLQQE